MRIIIRYEARGKHVLNIWWHPIAALAKAHKVLYNFNDVWGSLFVQRLASQPIFVMSSQRFAVLSNKKALLSRVVKRRESP